MKRFPGRVLGTTAIAATLLLTASACSAPEVDGAEGEGTEGLTPLNIVVAPIVNEPFYYGVGSGIFEEHGLDVTLVPGGTLPAQLVPVLLSGEGNVAMAGSLTLVTAVLQGLPIKAIYPVTLASDQPEPSSGFIVAPDSPITGYGDLDGATVAVPGLGEMPHLALTSAIAQNGGDPATVEFLEMPVTNVNDAIANGQIDGAVQVGSFYSQAVDAGFETFGSPSNDYYPGSVNIQLMATDEWIAGNEATLEKLFAALDEIMVLLNDNPEAIRDVQRAHTELPDEVIDAAVLPTYFTAYDRAGYEKVLDDAVTYGFIDEKPPLEDVVWSGAPIE